MEQKDFTPDINEMTDADARKRLIYISIDKLYPHPDNPRKDLGDLTELADSIKSSGVMQNLTVVPSAKTNEEYERLVNGYDENGVKYSEEYRNHACYIAFQDAYTVVIGHRRLAAAKQAGLRELPCVISDMDYPTQITTMMTENLQRADLTIYEQAQCLRQLKFDVGMSVERISEKTGQSASTVRRRLKLCELNQDTLKKVSGRQISMDDFDRLYKIEDPKLQNEALAEIGTANFNSKCTAAEQTQERKKRVEGWRKVCLEAGLIGITEKEGNSSAYTYAASIYDGAPSRKAIEPYLREGVPLYFYVNQYGYVYIKKRVEQPGADAQAKKDKEAQERQELDNICAALNDAFDRAYRMRFEFIKNYPEAEAKKHFLDILQMCVEVGEISNGSIYMSTFHRLVGYSKEEASKRPGWSDICEKATVGTNKLHLYFMYAAIADFPELKCCNTSTYDSKRGEYRRDYGHQKLTAIYAGLERLGYEMSDEEKALLDGTSELYYKKEETNDEDDED